MQDDSIDKYLFFEYKIPLWLLPTLAGRMLVGFLSEVLRFVH